MHGTEIAVLQISPVHTQQLRTPQLRDGGMDMTINYGQREAPHKLTVYPRSTERKGIIMHGTAPEKIKQKKVGVAVCANPAHGQEKVSAYIVGDLTEDEHREFIAHVADCRYCLEQIVLWRTAEVLAETEEQSAQAIHTA